MIRICIVFLLLGKISFAQPRTDSHLASILHAANSPLLQKILDSATKYRVQIIYTAIDRDQQNRPTFQHYFYNYNPELYYNPASVVKLPLAALSLEKLNRLNASGVNKYTAMLFDSSFAGQNIRHADSTAQSGLPSIAQFIRKAFLISDNDAYNRMYQFVGQKTIHRSLRAKGYSNILIPRQFRGYSLVQNRQSNAIRFVDKSGRLLYKQPPAYNTDSLIFPQKILLGKGHWNSRDSLIHTPMDFSAQNNVALFDFHRILQSILFPKYVKPTQRFDLRKSDYDFLKQYLSQYPSETAFPYYDATKFYDSYVKFFFRDSTHRMPESVRVFNKVGWSYGFLTDISYVADFKNNIEYMLSATVYVNSDDIINDGKYDYDELGYPFLYQLGQTIYNFELNRKRSHQPDLSDFKINYEKRNPNDQRKGIVEVEN